MSKINIIFSCVGCFKDVVITHWGYNYPQDSWIKNYEQNLHKKHTYDIKITFKRFDFIGELGQSVINYNYKGEFDIKTIDEIRIHRENEIVKEQYFYHFINDENGEDNVKHIEFPEYNYLDINPRDILKQIKYAAYINTGGIIVNKEIESINILKDFSKSYICYPNFKQFGLNDVIILSQFLKEFDEYNIENKIEKIGSSNIKKRLNDFREFKNYWMKKYYENNK